jgi:riboflavin kinase / FMN adenylyltransferase
LEKGVYMEVIRIRYPVENKMELQPSSVALGNFDGLHIGHQHVILTALQKGRDSGLLGGVMTFHPHPQEVLGGINQPAYLTPLEDKIRLLNDSGIDVLYVISFTKELSALKPEDFIQQYIVDLHIKQVVTGFDFRFGRQGAGDTATLQQWAECKRHFDVQVVSSVDRNHTKISSSRVRHLLAEGDVRQAASLLDRPFCIRGTVVPGEKRGRSLGFPTANIRPLYPYVLPKEGVYAVRVKKGDELFDGVLNLGRKPTFHNRTERLPVLETHLLDVDVDLYGEELEIAFCSYIREEVKFESVDALVDRIRLDIERARHLLRHS